MERDQCRQPRRQRYQHFLGAIVLHAHEARACQADRYEVIDGQQRITTLYLILAALRDVCDSKQIITRDSREDDLSMMLLNRRRHDDARYDRKLVPTVAFQPQLDEILSDGALIALRQRYPRRRNSQDPNPRGAAGSLLPVFCRQDSSLSRWRTERCR